MWHSTLQQLLQAQGSSRKHKENHGQHLQPQLLFTWAQTAHTVIQIGPHCCEGEFNRPSDTRRGRVPTFEYFAPMSPGGTQRLVPGRVSIPAILIGIGNTLNSLCHQGSQVLMFRTCTTPGYAFTMPQRGVELPLLRTSTQSNTLVAKQSVTSRRTC